MSGCEWIVEAHGCDATSLADVAHLDAVFRRIVEGMDLHPVAETAWHRFPGAGGVTGLSLLSESHIACHTFRRARPHHLRLGKRRVERVAHRVQRWLERLALRRAVAVRHLRDRAG